MISSTESQVQAKVDAAAIIAMLHPEPELRRRVARAAAQEHALFISCSDQANCLDRLSSSQPTCLVVDAELLCSKPEFSEQLACRAFDTPLIAVPRSKDSVDPVETALVGAWQFLGLQAEHVEIRQSLREGIVEAQRRHADRQLVTTFRDRFECLTPEELDVMQAVCDGKLNKQIASELGVSIRTVEQRRRRVFAKMDAPSAAPLASRWATVQTIERLRPHGRNWAAT